MPKLERPACPRCGKPMNRGSRAQSGKLRWQCRTKKDGVRTLCYQTTDPSKPARKPSTVEPTKQFESVVKAERLVITWAQNATPVHKGFLAALKTYCRENKAQLLVMPGRYRNPTSLWTDKDEGDQWWDEAVVPYLHNQRSKLNEHLVLLSDVNVQPTAVLPLSGFESLTHGESGILPHPKLQLECIPTPHQRLPKILTTTGAVTVPNYTDSKAGKKGEFHHVYGAVVIERAESKFYLRHINARSDGAFCDLDFAYYPNGTKKLAGNYAGLVFGDAHPQFADPAVVQATFGKGGLVERLQPDTLVFHDLLDSYAVNPHHIGNPFVAKAKYDSGRDSINVEVEQTITWLQARIGKRKAVIAPSNHDSMLERWIKRADWRFDVPPVDRSFYLETALYMNDNTRMTPEGSSTPDPFEYWVSKRGAKNITCLPRNTSYAIAGIECGLHGHEGPNGARGNKRNLSKIGAKTIIGHSHTPGIAEGCYQTGTMTFLQLEYTGPVSSWLNAHCSIDPFGKRHLHFCIDGAFWKRQK